MTPQKASPPGRIHAGAAATPGPVVRTGEWIFNELLSRPGVEERSSRFADRAALFFRGREFFHLDEPGLADVRVGRRSIRSHRDELRSDPRIEFRPNSSDWIHVRFSSRKDAKVVLRWADLAIGADA